MWSLASATGLDVNSPYAYVLWSDYQHATSLVARVRDELAGFVLGFRIPHAPADVFVWQIAVGPTHRGVRLGSALLDTLVARTRPSAIEATVTPSNEASAALFRSLATRHGGRVLVSSGYDPSLFPGRHEEEIRFRVLLDGDSSPTPAEPSRGESVLGDLRHPGV